eukprot:360423-Hanusia_phi.AAC.3
MPAKTTIRRSPNNCHFAVRRQYCQRNFQALTNRTQRPRRVRFEESRNSKNGNEGTGRGDISSCHGTMKPKRSRLFLERFGSQKLRNFFSGQKY